MNSITDLGSINFSPVEEKIEILESKIDDEYMDVIAEVVCFNKAALPDLPIVYSSSRRCNDCNLQKYNFRDKHKL